MKKSSLLMNTNPPHELLSDNQVAIWCARVPKDEDSRLWQSYLALLTSEEKDRNNRFAFEKDRRQFVLTRALERDVLSRYVGCEPASLVFTRNEYGKPFLGKPFGSTISYSLSHTKGLSVCAVASGGEVGVDVESLQRSTSHRDIAKRFFTTSEATYLEEVDPIQQSTEFLRLWTLKEAFIKARGLGFSIPLNSFEIKTFPDRPPSVSFPDGIHGNEAAWNFLQIRFGFSFYIALALNKGTTKKMLVRIFTIIPLTKEIVSVVIEPNEKNEMVVGEC